MGSSARLFTAMTLVVMPVTTGLFASPSFAADAVKAKGGCWGYTVAGTTSASEPGDLVKATLGATDTAGPAQITDGVRSASGRAPAQIAWTPGPEEATLALTSTGGTAKSGDRAFELTLSRGPALSSEAVAGRAHAALEVFIDGVASPTLLFASTDFTQAQGEHVSELTFVTEDGLELVDEGAYKVVLKSIYFVAPELDSEGKPKPDVEPQMWACNGQAATVPSALVTTPPGSGSVTLGQNPATSPEPIEGVEVAFDVADATTLTLSKVLGQIGTSSVRPGDEVLLSATGLATNTAYRVGFGPAAGPFVLSETEFLTDGSGAVGDPVAVLAPADIAAGEGIVTLLDADGEPAGAPLRLSFLGVPELVVEESAGESSLELSVSGAHFDPGAEVRLRSRVGDQAAKDDVLRVAVGADGTFSTSYEVADADADAVRALQRRVDGRAELSALHTIVGEVPTPSPSPATPSPLPSSVPVPSPASSTPVNPPAQIPIPVPVPIDSIGAEPGSTPGVGEPSLSVSKARLEGTPGMGELFGGSSQRQVRFEVENTGDQVEPDPQVMLGVGRTEEAQPTLVAASLGDLDPGARVAVAINVSLPMASLGTYQVVGQVGSDADSSFSVRWDTYPWGLIAVNVAGIGLLVWGVNRRRSSVAPLPAGPGGEEMGASVVDLTALDKWWKEGKVVHTVVEAEVDNDSVVDLDAADRWWSKNQHNVS